MKNARLTMAAALAAALLAAAPASAAPKLLNVSYDVSSKQARSVIDGLQADVVTMNNPLDNRCHRQGRADQVRLGAAAALGFQPFLVHHSVSGAQGQSQAHQGLE